MKRKESKLPLLLAAIVLGYFIFWAIGYVNRNRPAAPPQPVEALAKEPDPAAISQQQPSPAQPVQTDPIQAPATAPSTNQAASPPSYNNPTGDGPDIDNSGKTLRNPKIGGIIKEVTGRH